MKKNSKEELNLEALSAVWQQESARVEEIVTEHTVTHAQLNRHARRLSPHRRQLMITQGYALLGAAALVWLIAIYDKYVVDELDLVAHIVVAIPLLFVLVDSQLAAASLFRLRIPKRPIGAASRHISCLTAAVAIMAVFIVVVTPAYEGRTMSACGMHQRAMAINTVNQMLENLSNTAL